MDFGHTVITYLWGMGVGIVIGWAFIPSWTAIRAWWKKETPELEIPEVGQNIEEEISKLFAAIEALAHKTNSPQAPKVKKNQPPVVTVPVPVVPVPVVTAPTIAAPVAARVIATKGFNRA